MKEEKEILRKLIKKELGAMSKPNYEHQSFQISQKLYKNPNWVNAKIIGITISNFPEVDTYQIIRKCWELGKDVVVPKCYPKTKEMVFRKIQSFNQLESVYYGLYEPKEEVTNEVKKESIDLLIVPGVVYSRKGYRIGFGGGYFDRFLTNFDGPTISLAFSNQVVESLPYENHDIPVKCILTNNEVIHTNV